MKTAQTVLKDFPVLTGRIVTADPLHNQHDTARIIVEKGGDYILQVKDNQKNLRKFIASRFNSHHPEFGLPEKGHGRIEQRAIAILPTSAMQSSFTYARSIIAVWSRRTIRNKTTETIRYYISSLAPNSHSKRQWQTLIRGHWGGVENRNHWSKDAVWQEDRTRSRNPNLVGNLALLRNALLKIYIDHKEYYGSLPAFTETVRSNSNLAFRLICAKLRV